MTSVKLSKLAGLFLGAVLGDVHSLYWRFCILKPRHHWSLDDGLLSSLNTCSGKLCYSYVTELMLLLAEEVLENGQVIPESLATRFACRAKLGKDVRCYDRTLALLFRSIRRGIPWEAANREVNTLSDTSNCAAAARVTPITIYFSDLTDIIEETTKQALVTNYNEYAVEGALIYAAAQYMVIKGIVGPDLVHKLLKYVDKRAFRIRLIAIPKLLNEEPKTVAKVIGNSSKAYEAVPAAIYCYLRSGGNPLKAIKYSVSLGGNVSDIAIMASSLAAAESGISNKIFRTIRNVENSNVLLNILQSLISVKLGKSTDLSILTS